MLLARRTGGTVLCLGFAYQTRGIQQRAKGASLRAELYALYTPYTLGREGIAKLTYLRTGD